MVDRRKLTHAVAACAALLAGAASACEETILLEYDIRGGGYQFEVNGVYLESGGAQFASGGAPIKDWLLEGDNVVTVRVDADQADFSLYALCGGSRKDFDTASLTGRAKAELTFSVADPAARAYHGAEPTSDQGLLSAVEALKSALDQRDFDAVWAFHAAMQEDMTLAGRPMKSEAYRMGKIVENIEPSYAPELEAHPVLGGRVWEVYGAEFAPPISAVVEMNGGTTPFKTGSFWMRVDGEWSVLVR